MQFSSARNDSFTPGVDNESTVCSERPSFNPWSIVFSHPEDFVPYDLETDRWIVLLRRAFQDSEVWPVELVPDNCPQLNCSWVSAVVNEIYSKGMQELFEANSNAIARQARLLCAKLEQAGPRFVAILDGSSRLHRTFRYFRGSCVPSPLEILGWAVTLRARRG